MKAFNTSLIIFIIGFLLISCENDNERILIKDFSKKQTITLKPNKFYPYSMMNIRVRGFVNDTVLIKLKSTEAQPILKLKGDFDETWKTDYYGEGPRTLIFEPYKATKGELEIEFNL